MQTSLVTPDHTEHVMKRKKGELVRQMKKMVIVLLMDLGILLGLYRDSWQMDQVVDQKMNQKMRSSGFYIGMCLLSSQYDYVNKSQD